MTTSHMLESSHIVAFKAPEIIVQMKNTYLLGSKNNCNSYLILDVYVYTPSSVTIRIPTQFFTGT